MEQSQMDVLIRPKKEWCKKKNNETNREHKKRIKDVNYRNSKSRAKKQAKKELDNLITIAKRCNDIKVLDDIFEPYIFEKLIIAVLRRLRSERYYPQSEYDEGSMSKEYKNIKECGDDLKGSLTIPYPAFIIRGLQVALKEDYLKNAHGFYYDISINQKIDLNNINVSEFD